MAELDNISFAQEVGKSFVRQYYNSLASGNFGSLDGFYGKESVFSFDGAVIAIGATEIKEQYTKLGFQNVIFDLEGGSFDFAPSFDGGIIIIVGGSIVTEDSKSKAFTQTFFLAPSDSDKSDGVPSSFFVMNDILRFPKEVENGQVEAGKLVEFEVPKEEIVEPQHGQQETAVSIKEERPNNEEVSKKVEEEAKPIAEEEGQSGETAGQGKAGRYSKQRPPRGEHFTKTGGRPQRKYVSTSNAASSGDKKPKEDAKPQPSSWASIVSSKKEVPSTPAESTSTVQNNIAAETKPAAAVQNAAHPAKSKSFPRQAPAARNAGATAFLKDVEKEITDQMLKDAFETYGAVKSVDINRDKRYGFIFFESSVSLKNAMAASPVIVQGRELIVQERTYHGSGRSFRSDYRRPNRARKERTGENNGVATNNANGPLQNRPKQTGDGV